jgi:hypothetical protein
MSITNIDELEQLDETALREFVEDNKLNYDHYGLPIVEIDGDQYAIAFGDDEADKATTKYIQNSVWAFNPDFIANCTEMPVEIFECMAKSDMCESANDAIMACIDHTCGFDSFVRDAIDLDGRGHFLAFYDGEEIELTNAYAYKI